MEQKTFSTKTYTITAALPYANGPIHIGHVAGVYLPADIYARYQRGKKHEVAFISGSDEGGAAITLGAKKLHISPQELVDKYHALNKKALYDFGISFDIFSRTSSKHHHQVARDFFLELHSKGALELHESEHYYDAAERLFLADRYIKGTCPKCQYAEAYGDQCEQCGSTLSPEELIEPKSTLSDASLVKKKTSHWYLPLAKYEDWLKQWLLQEKKDDLKVNVYGQCKSLLSKSLQSRAITRDLPWGVVVPLKQSEGKVLYVWFEAPIGYISATQAWAKEQKKDWRLFWQHPNTKLIHFVGKDNIVFHCLIFPVMIKAHGGYILPENIPANEFMNLEGKKISTSRGHAIWLHEYLAKYPDQQDVLRYVLCAGAPETKDGDFTWKDFKAKNNHELVAVLGNFVHRTLMLIHKYFSGRVPEKGRLTDVDKAVVDQMQKLPGEIAMAIEDFKFRRALGLWMQLARVGNKYLSDTAPWQVFSKDPVRVGTVLYVCSQVMARVALFGEPFLPFTSKKLTHMLNLHHDVWDDATQAVLLPAGHVLQKSVMLFSKIDD